MRTAMCLLLIAYRQHPQYPLLLLANRDEFYRRPTAPAQPWEHGGIVAGRDLEAGGTWLGIAPGGRVAAVTNIREPGTPEPPDVLSRGEIPTGFLAGNRAPSAYADALLGERYRGFNALLFDPRAEQPLVCAGNRHRPFAITAGFHGISNGAPDDPWPKVTRGCESLTTLVANLPHPVDTETFVTRSLALLADSKRAPQSQLPDTGVGTAMESALSSIFVRVEAGDLDAHHRPAMSGGYGTRASTLVLVDNEGAVQLWEQSYTDGLVNGAPRYFHLPPS
ncbi:NRDE family protein [Microbulbifer sp.]|uniref:NRDE family protein n=1 Tax=Microbulbifer sp. TaxID=1908541 RepID=UPI002F9570B3